MEKVAYCCSSSEKKTHHGNLWEETETHKSYREKSHGDECIRKGHAANLVHQSICNALHRSHLQEQKLVGSEHTPLIY